LEKNSFGGVCFAFGQVGIEIVETVADKEQDSWQTINPDQVK